jgi:phage tail tape-measure protein
MKHEAKKAPERKAPADDIPAGVPRHDDHALAGAAALSGAVAGAIAGAVGGPAGVVAGSAIGGALGAIGGAALEREEHRHDKHDHELDDEIGVTRGSLGVPEEDKRPSRDVIDEAEAAERKRRGEA